MSPTSTSVVFAVKDTQDTAAPLTQAPARLAEMSVRPVRVRHVMSPQSKVTSRISRSDVPSRVTAKPRPAGVWQRTSPGPARLDGGRARGGEAVATCELIEIRSDDGECRWPHDPRLALRVVFRHPHQLGLYELVVNRDAVVVHRKSATRPSESIPFQFRYSCPPVNSAKCTSYPFSRRASRR